ncbi:ATP-binding protein [Methanothermococcus okinawensis]|uniref:4Fe-4S ferredoxin iron-sulfur binding domain-containing protein n=1 Tax=Methanothermococcus okinawensis (strain DSM 14208 / JCM 11175 / IH1) TaxID=647113 RepID=F8AL78_METOI|nr:4Fe-4S dicluster domain-containing protein [Methanothermococcus okinawensis]AEH06613.1 4Fe-4S ferredoxin iron-sulfur binding domain-containing protein [Methanothermococcus okinawensis IH1]
MFSKIKHIIFGGDNKKTEKTEKEFKKDNVWGPTIDYTKCKNCTLCYKVCENGVFGIVNGRVTVINKSNCVKGCSKCLSVCRYGALSF